MDVKRGDVVTTVEGTSGIVTDLDRDYTDALVQLTEGEDLTTFDTTHGRWYGYDEILSVVGYRPDFLVWSGARMRPAQEVNGDTR